MIGCAALAAGAVPAAASSRPSHRPAGHRSHKQCAHASARASARARATKHVCHANVRAPHARVHVKSSPSHASRPTPAPRPEQTAPAQSHQAQSTAATIAAVLATPCQNTELSPNPGNLALVRAAVLCLINRERAQNDEDPLESNVQLEQAAEGHSQELIADDYFAHVSPSGETPVDRIRATGYIPNATVGYVIGENLAWGTYQLSTPQAIVSAWIASPGHLANILEAQYRETGIGVTPDVPQSLAADSPGATYAQEFGVILR
jgi:uncharacterized protein YkwD